MKIYYLSNENIYTGIATEYIGKIPPSGTTTIPPLAYKDGYAVKFNGVGAEYIELHSLIPVDNRDLATIYADILKQVVDQANGYMNQVKIKYSLPEIDSWSEQRTQAEAILAGTNLPENALIYALATANNTTVQEFATRIMLNVSQAEAITVMILSQQQAFEYQLKQIMNSEAEDSIKMAEIKAMVIQYSVGTEA